MLSLRQWNLLGFLLLATGSLLVNGQCADKSDAIKLMKSLFCGYDRTVRPVQKHSDVVNVTISFWIKHFQFEVHQNILELNTWTVWTWRDTLLNWDPRSYSLIEELRVESDSIWVPDVSLYTMGEMGGFSHRMPSTTCILKYDGRVTCAPPTTHSAYCAADLTRWPFDTHQCVVEMGSWTHTGNELNLTLSNNKMLILELYENREWDMLSVEGKHDAWVGQNITYPYLQITAKLKRHYGGYAATVVVPAFVLAVLTLLMFFLDPLSSERLTLGCMNVLVHCLYMEYLGYMIPSNGEYTPLIVVFFRDSMLLLGMSLLTTVLLKVMLAAERAPPAWISSSVDWVVESIPGQVLMLNQLHSQGSSAAVGEDGNGLGDNLPNSQKKNPWSTAAALLDRVCLIVFTITLIVMLLAFVP